MTDAERIAALERRVAEFKIADDRYQLMKLVVEGHSYTDEVTCDFNPHHSMNPNGNRLRLRRRIATSSYLGDGGVTNRVG